MDDSTTFLLAKTTFADKHGIALPEERYARIRDHKRNLVRALEIEERFDILLANYVEFETEVLGRSVEHNLYSGRDEHQMHEDRLGLNRRIVNLLTACRLYLDQLAHGMSGTFGDGEETTAIGAARSREYDASFSYRLMEGLRDYVQHRGLAAGSYSVMQQATGDGRGNQLACTVTPRLVARDLLNDPKRTRRNSFSVACEL